jgi:hypothetical protein
MGTTARAVTWGAVAVSALVLAMGMPFLSSFVPGSVRQSSHVAYRGNRVSEVRATGGEAALSASSRLMDSTSRVTRPRLVPEITDLIPGERVNVEGLDFPSHALVNLELCGLDGESSSDCLVGGAVSTVASGNGFFVAPFVIGIPPVDCPCVIQALGPALATPVTAPIVLEGVPIATTISPSTSSHTRGTVEIRHVSVSGSGPWEAWFGGSPSRTVVLDVVNSTSRSRLVSLEMRLGDKRALSTPRLGRIPADSTKRFSLLVTLPALSFGTESIQGKLAAKGIGSSRFDARVFSVPWALLALIWLVVVAAIAFLVDRLISSRQARPVEDPSLLASLPPPVGAPLWPGESPPPTTRVRVIPPGAAQKFSAGAPGGWPEWPGQGGQVGQLGGGVDG